jgi:hypothetical protein
MGFLQVVAAVVLFISSTHAAVFPSGFSISLGEADYFLLPKVAAKIDGCDEIKSKLEYGNFLPFTVIPDGHVVEASIVNYASDDDVWQEAFLEGMLMYCWMEKLD